MTKGWEGNEKKCIFFAFDQLRVGTALAFALIIFVISPTSINNESIKRIIFMESLWTHYGLTMDSL